MKRVFALLVAMLMVLALIPAMAEGEGTIKRQENGYPDFEGRTFTIWYRNRQPDTTDDLTNMENVKKLEQLLNCNFVFIHPPQGQEKDHFALMMAEDKLPDMFFCKAFDNWYPGGIQMAYEDGILYDYTDLINETNTPLFCEIMLGDPEIAPLMYDDSGRIVRLGAKIQGSATCDFWYYGLRVYEPALKETGLEAPETIDDWYKMLTAMKANGVETPLYMSNGSNENVIFFSFAYGIISNDFYVDEETGTVHYGPYEPVYKDFLAEMNKWYTEGLINSDFMNATASDGTALMLDGKVGAQAGHVWEWAWNFIPNNPDPDKHQIGVIYPKLNKEDPITNLRARGRNFDDFKYITVDAEDKLACVMLLDALYNEEISYNMGDGVQGVAWDYDENGLRVSKSDVDPLFKGISEWHTYEDTDVRYLESKWNGEPADGIRTWGQATSTGRVPDRFLMYTTEEAEVRSKVMTDIQTYVNEMQLKFITGQTSLDEFDSYIEQLKAMGVEDYIAVTQSAYTRLQNRR